MALQTPTHLILPDLDSLGTKGFTIQGAANIDRLGYSVSGGGDINGDGLDDLIVSSKWE